MQPVDIFNLFKKPVEISVVRAAYYISWLWQENLDPNNLLAKWHGKLQRLGRHSSTNDSKKDKCSRIFCEEIDSLHRPSPVPCSSVRSCAATNRNYVSNWKWIGSNLRDRAWIGLSQFATSLSHTFCLRSNRRFRLTPIVATKL